MKINIVYSKISFYGTFYIMDLFYILNLNSNILATLTFRMSYVNQNVANHNYISILMNYTNNMHYPNDQ